MARPWAAAAVQRRRRNVLASGRPLPAGPAARLLGATRLGRRLGRAGIHHFLPETGVLFAGRSVYRLAEASGRIEPVGPLYGSRPLAVASDGALSCYGEYRPNPERTPVHIRASSDRGRTWDVVHTFDGVRHVHGVFHDAWSDAFWITTGDEDAESGIWRTRDGFRSVERVLGGTQQARAVHLSFTKRHVYFGSDTPRAANHLQRMERDSGRVESLQRVGSSVFYGCQAAGHLFFSTAAEPSRVNRTDGAEIWHSPDGVSWRLLARLPNDRWPSRLFQYGQVLFPSGPGDGRHLYYTPQGVNGDGRTRVVRLSELAGPGKNV